METTALYALWNQGIEEKRQRLISFEAICDYNQIYWKLTGITRLLSLQSDATGSYKTSSPSYVHA